MKKSISPVGIDVEISQLLLDVRSKTTNFQKRFLYFTLIYNVCVCFFGANKMSEGDTRYSVDLLAFILT